MLKIIKKWWAEHKASIARQKFLSSPIGYETAKSIHNILNTDDTYVGKYLSQERKSFLFNNIMSHAFFITSSNNPILECRNFICNNIDIMACFKILTIRPTPNIDYSGCRGLPGITGEIFGYLPEIVKIDETLQKYVYSLDVSSATNPCINGEQACLN